MEIRSKLSSLMSGGRLWLIAVALGLGVVLLTLGGSGQGKVEEESISAERYAAALESEIATLCGGVSGVSNVTVAVSLSGGIEYVYATDSKGDPVTVGGGSSASGLVVRQKMPEIAGVGIVCRGGNDPDVQRRLISLIGAAYGVSSNRIYVTEAR